MICLRVRESSDGSEDLRKLVARGGLVRWVGVRFAMQANHFFNVI